MARLSSEHGNVKSLTLMLSSQGTVSDNAAPDTAWHDDGMHAVPCSISKRVVLVIVVCLPPLLFLQHSPGVWG